MSFGFDNAMNEITLVLFTTLAPAGAVACALVCLLLLVPTLEQPCRERIGQFLWIPILVALVGLVASATHLGNPSNALYVLTGVGRSPLSNEIFFAIMAFGLAGGYWLLSFSQFRRPMLERIWLIAAACSAVCFLLSMAFAYDVDTIVTWALPTTPVNLVFNALVAGPLIALVVFVSAEHSFEGGSALPAMYNVRIGRALVSVAGIALVANAVSYEVQAKLMLGLVNSTISVAQLVPHYYACLAAFVVLAGAGVALDALVVFKKRKVTRCRVTVATALALVGIAVMRFVFYMSYMTVGVSL